MSEEFQIELDGILIEVLRKRIRHINLKVSSPDGTVRISAPFRASLKSIRDFAVSKLGWIKKHQKKMKERMDSVPPEYFNRNNYMVLGELYPLKLMDSDSRPFVVLENGSLVLHAKAETSEEERELIIEKWYRAQLKKELVPLVEKWERTMGVKVRKVFIRRMKTKWGSCNYIDRNIRISTELAKRPLKCLEYVVVHELAHLLERTHNSRFIEIMDRYLPDWRERNEELNRFPMR